MARTTRERPSNIVGVVQHNALWDAFALKSKCVEEGLEQDYPYRCPVCGKHFEIDDMEADHITPWHAGGKTDPANCQMLCKDDNRRKAGV